LVEIGAREHKKWHQGGSELHQIGKTQNEVKKDIMSSKGTAVGKDEKGRQIAEDGKRLIYREILVEIAKKGGGFRRKGQALGDVKDFLIWSSHVRAG